MQRPYEQRHDSSQSSYNYGDSVVSRKVKRGGGKLHQIYSSPLKFVDARKVIWSKCHTGTNKCYVRPNNIYWPGPSRAREMFAV